MSDHCLSFVSTLAVLASAPYYLKVEKNINTFKNFVLIGMKTNPCISRYAAVINLISFMYSFLDLKNIYIYINFRYIYIYITISNLINYSCVSSLSSEIASCIDSLAISSTESPASFILLVITFPLTGGMLIAAKTILTCEAFMPV